MANTLTIAPQGTHEITFTRAFDASPERLFDALCLPDLMRQWFWGPEEWPVQSLTGEARVGGNFRIVWRNTGSGKEMPMSGTWREITRPTKLVWTEIFDEDWTGGEALNTCVLEKQGAKTLMVVTALYSSTAARDAILKPQAEGCTSSMEEGCAQSYDRLERHFAAGSF